MNKEEQETVEELVRLVNLHAFIDNKDGHHMIINDRVKELVKNLKALKENKHMNKEELTKELNRLINFPAFNDARDDNHTITVDKVKEILIKLRPLNYTQNNK